MTKQKIGIIMNGVTGRMGTNQHLMRSIVAIRQQGGVVAKDGSVLYPDPILVGRNANKLQALAVRAGVEKWSTNLEECLADPQYSIYFDAQTTSAHADSVKAALKAGKNVYCEKPLAPDVETALSLAKAAKDSGLKNGIVQDKLFLPGMRKLKRLVDGGFFGKILSVRGEFGYWVFEGDWQPAQRPSWNYRKEDGGGIILDMFCHWQYVLAGILAPAKALSAIGATHIETRYDEQGKAYTCTADDAAYGTFELEGGIIAQMNSSWAVRVDRGELFELQVDGTHGSAVAGLLECKTQHRANTPKAVWNPDIANPFKFADQWENVPNNAEFDNAFKVQWEMFIKHVYDDSEPFPHDFLEGAKGVQLAELGLKSWAERRWLDVPELSV
jgi:predicted dehydrogenase